MNLWNEKLKYLYDRWLDPPAGISNCDCLECEHCGGKSWDGVCTHGEDDRLCWCIFCNCGKKAIEESDFCVECIKTIKGGYDGS
jgi:hypothetical protein